MPGLFDFGVSGNWAHELLSGENWFGRKPKLETQQVTKWTPEQQALFKALYPGVSAGATNPWTPTPEETSYMSFLRGYELWYTSKAGEIANVYSPEATKSYFSNTVLPQWQQNILPGIKENYAGPGYWGTARADAVAKSLNELGTSEATALYGTEQARQKALADMLQQGLSTVPIAKEQLATWAAKYQDPTQQPYFKAALALLGLEPFDTVAAMNPGTVGVVGELLGAAGKTVGGLAAGGYL